MADFIFDVIEENRGGSKRGFVDLNAKKIFIYDDIKGEVLFEIPSTVATPSDGDIDTIAYSIALG